MRQPFSYLAAGCVGLFALHATAAPSMSTVQALSFPPDKVTAVSVPLPAGSKAVGFGVAGGRLFCKAVRLVASDASVSGVFGDDELPDKASKIMSTTAQKSYVTVEATCQAKDASAKLVISAGPGL